MELNRVRALRFAALLAFLVLPSLAHASEWFLCGNLGELSSCELPQYPTTHYEYGIVYNPKQPVPVICSRWNVGLRLHNKDPYFTRSDNPTSGMLWGGFMFYTNTLATDDDECRSGTWRHRYWHLGADNAVVADGGNGCLNPPIYCRLQ